jgi:hypothetical protein
MGGAVSATKEQLKDEQKMDLFDEFVDTAQKEKPNFRPPATTNEEKLQFFNDHAPTFETFAEAIGFSDSLLKSMDENYKRRSQKFIEENTQVKKVSASQMFREKNGKLEKVVMEGTGRKAGAPGWRYKPGDAMKRIDGTTIFTVRKCLGRGAFGEVHVAYDEFDKRERAMKVRMSVRKVRFSVRVSEGEGGGCRVRVLGLRFYG